MTEPLSWKAAYAERLRELHEAAGSPTGQRMEKAAQRRTPRPKFSDSSWSEWRRGLRVPSHQDTAHWLIEEYLRPLAQRTAPGFVAPPPRWWEETRLKAQAELASGGRPPMPHPPAPPYEPLPVIQVGRIPPEGDHYQHREPAERLVEAAAEDGGLREARSPGEPLARDFFSDLIEQHTRLFAGRWEESAQVLEFIRDRATGYVFVEALSGYGKTSLLADLVRQHPEFRYHFISQAYRRRGGGFDPTSPEDVLECLCEQLDPAHVRGGGLKSLERQFHALLKRPPQEPTVVVLDAVDELEPPDQLRTLLPRRLPEGLVLVLSGRAQGDRSCLDDIALSPADVGLHLRLTGLDEQALVELLRMAGGKAAGLAGDADFVAQMHRVSAGDPFYVRFLVEDAATGVLTRDNVERAPTGLEGYLDQQLEQLNRSAHRAEHVEILRLLLEAGTLSRMDLCALIGGLTWLNFDSIVREIHRFLLVHHRTLPGLAPHRGHEEYSFCHARFREYFRGRAGIVG